MTVHIQRFTTRLFLIALLTGASTIAAAGEQESPAPSRAELLARERDAKAAETAPPERSLVERGLYWYDNQHVLQKISAGWHGFRLAGGSFPAGAGTAAGVSFAHHSGFQAVTAYSTRGYTRGGAGFTLGNLDRSRVSASVRGEYIKFPQEDFFGLGRDSRKEDRTDYLLENTEIGAELRWKPASLIEVAGGISHLSPRIDSGTDSRFPSTEQLFDPSALPGFSAQPDFWRGDASVAFDWRDNPRHPHAGGRYGVRVSDYRDKDLNAFDFRRVDVDLQQYVPLPDRYRLVALRAAATFTTADDGNDVPFYFQPTLGGSQALRGFREFRFRDRNSVLLTAEYRWEAWWALDGALFVDAGTVAASRRDLTLSNFDVSYGIGFRVHSNDAFVTRLDLAYSREGFIPLLRFEHVF